MDKLETIISNNEKKNEKDIFRFTIMLVVKVVLALMTAILAIKYCYEKEWVSAIIDGILAILWCENIIIEIDIFVLKIESNSRMSYFEDYIEDGLFCMQCGGYIDGDEPRLPTIL